jgi:hypothetical protein
MAVQLALPMVMSISADSDIQGEQVCAFNHQFCFPRVRTLVLTIVYSIHCRGYQEGNGLHGRVDVRDPGDGGCS